MHRSSTLALVLVACSFGRNATPAPEPATLPSVVFLYPVDVDALKEVEQGVREALGGRQVNLTAESAQGDPERFQPAARAAVRSGADVIVGMGTQMSQAVLALGSEMKLPQLVFTAVTDPADVVGAGALGSPRALAVTGVTDSPVDLDAKTFELVRAVAPGADAVGVFVTPSEANSVSAVEHLTTSLPPGVSLERETTDSGVDKAALALIARGVDVIVITKDKNATGGVSTIVETALRAARERGKLPVPVIAMDSGSVSSGAIAAASAPYRQIGIDTGKIVARILDGESASSIAISAPSNSTLMVNLDAASSFCLKGLKAALPAATFTGTEEASRCVIAAQAGR